MGCGKGRLDRLVVLFCHLTFLCVFYFFVCIFSFFNPQLIYTCRFFSAEITLTDQQISLMWSKWFWQAFAVPPLVTFKMYLIMQIVEWKKQMICLFSGDLFLLQHVGTSTSQTPLADWKLETAKLLLSYCDNIKTVALSSGRYQKLYSITANKLLAKGVSP